MKRITLLVFAISLCFYGYAQVSVSGTPPSFTQSLNSTINTYPLPAVDEKKLLKEDEEEQKLDKSQPWRFGKDFEVKLSLNNAGTWETLSNGDRIWRLKIKSQGARSLNFIFDEFYMPIGADFYIYNEDHSYVIGAFTSINNKSHGQFSTAPVKGSTVIMEYYEPQAVAGQGKIIVSSIIHAYKDLFEYAKKAATKGYGDSGSCNIDVACTQADSWRDEIKSVAMIMTAGGSRLCSGAMVNNTLQDKTPYFLTANHCWDPTFSTWVFVFNYDSPSCNGPDGSLATSISGSTLKARYATSDFALLELSTTPPPSYDIYYAGWSTSPDSALTSTGIHHPAGDVKKISHNHNFVTTGTYSTSSHWRVDNWEQGTTEGGSSGSPLFDQNHRIVGQLHGGAASCTVIDFDEYGKFSASWNGGGTTNSSLQPWLDPSNSVVTLDGTDFECGATNLTALATDSSAFLTWFDNIDTITNFILRYKAIDSTSWTTINISDTIMSYTITNLMLCTDYEFQVNVECNGVWSGFSNSFEFKSDGCCEPPSNLSVMHLNDSTSVLSGNYVWLGTSHEMRYREVGTTNWTTTTGLSSISDTLTGLTYCTPYEVEWRTICPNDTTAWINFTFINCGNCTNLPYCTSSGDIVADEWIEEVIFNTINNNSGVATSGYSNFTNISTTLQAGQSYPISLSQGYSGTVYSEHFAVWIDFDQDGIFSNTEQVYTSGATTTTPNTGTVTIPLTAIAGATRMRVSMRWNSPPASCGSFNYGEVEDYCLDIIPAGAFCAIPNGLNTSNETTSSADLAWNAVNSAVSYNVRYREAGAANWTMTTSNTNSLSLSGLTDCQNYEFEVEADCDTIGTSGYSTTGTFMTVCICDAITDLDTVVINSNDVTFSWTATNNNQSYEVSYKETSASTWNTVSSATTTYQLTSLAPGTLYNTYVKAICVDGTVSTISNIFTFRTDWNVSTNSLPTDITKLTVFPNPTKANLVLSVDMTRQQDIAIEVSNVAGQILYNQISTLNAGQNAVLLNFEDFTSGVYIIRLTTENGVATRRVIKN